MLSRCWGSLSCFLPQPYPPLLHQSPSLSLSAACLAVLAVLLPLLLLLYFVFVLCVKCAGPKRANFIFFQLLRRLLLMLCCLLTSFSSFTSLSCSSSSFLPLLLQLLLLLHLVCFVFFLLLVTDADIAAQNAITRSPHIASGPATHLASSLFLALPLPFSLYPSPHIRQLSRKIVAQKVESSRVDSKI